MGEGEGVGEDEGEGAGELEREGEGAPATDPSLCVVGGGEALREVGREARGRDHARAASQQLKHHLRSARQTVRCGPVRSVIQKVESRRIARRRWA